MKKIAPALLMVFCFLIAACSPALTPAPTALPTSIPTPTLSPEILQSVVEADETQVVIQGFTFEPSELVIHAGTKVTWVCLDIARHNVSAKNGEFDSGLLLYGDTYSFTFDKIGEYPYFNKNFRDAKGIVIVIP